MTEIAFLSAEDDSDAEPPELPGDSDSDSDGGGAGGRPDAKKRNTAGPWGRRYWILDPGSK
jgi:hypothetical protein